MSAKLYSLRGGTIPPPPDAPPPDKDTVSALERMLQEAHAGRIRGLCWVATHIDEAFSTDAVGEAISPTAVGLLFGMMVRIQVQLEEEDDDD